MLDFSEMLPVGMVAHGGQVAQIMAEIAKRQRGLPEWEAFHYERISETAFELTGGIVSALGGNKRWLEPHDCVTVPLTAVIQEMQKQGLLTPMALESEDSALSGMAAQAVRQQGDILHVSFVLPIDPIGRQRLLKTFHLQADFFGAEVIACRLDAISRRD